MSVTEALKFADELIFSQTGRHLDDLQKAVVKGVWEGQTYSAIAGECNRSESRVRDIGYKLWEVLSERLGENISKSNFRSTFERLQLTSSQIVNIHSNHNFNFCSYPHHPPNNGQKVQDNHQPCYYNLTIAPKITRCYGRNNELSTLCQWLENPHTHLISVLGIAGIGKSTLVRHLIDINTQPFDAIIWKNIKLSQSLDSLVTEILTEIEINNNSQNQNNALNQFLKLLNQQRCLIILDHVQEVFATQQFAGQYQPQYTDYKTFWQMITEVEHQSCFILISQEKCQGMISLDNELYPSQCLELSGLDESAKHILQDRGLKDEDTWSHLINLYEGHPKYLQYIATLIKDVFQGNVSEFIEEDCLILTEDLKSLFDSIWSRLSEVEKQILLKISQEDYPLSREEIRESLSLSSMDAIGGLQSLKRRFLLTQLERDITLFNISCVFREYLRVARTQILHHSQ